MAPSDSPDESFAIHNSRLAAFGRKLQEKDDPITAIVRDLDSLQRSQRSLQRLLPEKRDDQKIANLVTLMNELETQFGWPWEPPRVERDGLGEVSTYEAEVNDESSQAVCTANDLPALDWELLEETSNITARIRELRDLQTSVKAQMTEMDEGKRLIPDPYCGPAEYNSQLDIEDHFRAFYGSEEKEDTEAMSD